jgi:hypothetical protein
MILTRAPLYPSQSGCWHGLVCPEMLWRQTEFLFEEVREMEDRCKTGLEGNFVDRHAGG